MMALDFLSADKLRRVCDHNDFDFDTTTDLEPAGVLIGQLRASQAMEFGIGIESKGFNILVLGPAGTGRTTAIRCFLQERAAARPTPSDWLYVNNFPMPHQPRAIELPAGEGAAFKAATQRLVKGIKEDLDRSCRRQSDRDSLEASIADRIGQLQKEYAGHEEIGIYLSQVGHDLAEQLDHFEMVEAPAKDIDWRRYEVNLLVDNGRTTGAPVIDELNPTLHNLMGRVEYEVHAGMLSPHFTSIRPGSLHRANGGFLLLNMGALQSNSDAWAALKRALADEKISLPPVRQDHLATSSLEPEPIPLKAKIILIGEPDQYYDLYDEDGAFRELFKVRAEFDDKMPRDPEHELSVARFIARLCREERLRHLDRPAVARVIEFSSRLAGHQERLSSRFAIIADLVREASYWAGCGGRDVVSAQDVAQAQADRIRRASQEQEQLREEITEGVLFISATGAVVGQVNALSILEAGDYRFAQPGRITARVYMGESGVVNIEREVDMAGPIHNKGMLILNGYLGGAYAQKQPLSLSASLTFEQNYNDIDGDSAAAAELVALLSALSEIPLKQGIAVTGSVNQRGELHPVGGVNEKIEGFFEVCRALGLTGAQGVIIPAANRPHLMVREEVVAAVTTGRFHVWAVETINEALEILTGKPAGQRNAQGDYPKGSIHHAVQQRLFDLARALKRFGDHE